MLTAVGLTVTLTIIILLLMGRVSPLVGLTLVPIVGALIVGFGVTEIGEFFESGLDSVMDVAVMFVFAILYFGIMRDVGLFQPLINHVIRMTRGNVVAISVGTVLVASLSHLDGSGATTFLITIPAFLPLYQRLGMSPYLLVTLVAAGIGVLNLLPWAGPIGRAASVIGMDPVELWRPLVPVQAIALVLLIAMAVVMGMREQRRIARRSSTGKGGNVSDTDPKDGGAHAHPGAHAQGSTHTLGQEEVIPFRLWANAPLTVAVVATLVSGALPAGYVFMIGLCLALLINFPKVQDQLDKLKAHAPNALMMGSIILAAGSFLGIMESTGMLESVAQDLAAMLPAAMVPYLHLVVGFFGAPMDLLMSTDAYYFAMLPVVEQVVTTHGVAATTTVYAMAIGNNIGAMISPFAPAVWMALGLAGIEMGRYIRYAFLWIWGLSILVMLAAILIGVIPV